MSMEKKLDEVSFIRPILIIMLVFYHAFIIHGGGWETQIPGFEKIEILKWADLLSYSFMLETFVFISGYIFYFQIVELNRNHSIWKIAKKKFIRLLLPCWVFSIIYVVAYGHNGNIFGTIYYIALGAGHLWFLPMLFWCFIFGVVFRREVSFKILPFLIIAALISYNPLPLRLNQVMYYFLFFYLGMLAYCYKDTFVRKISNTPKLIIVLWIVFMILFVTGTLLNGQLRSMKANYTQLLPRVLIQMAINMVQILYSTMGLLSMYLTALLVVKKRTLRKEYVNFGNYCFAIYIFQQFILMYLYFHTSLFSMVGSFWLPFVGFVITMAFSYIFAKVSHSL